VGCNAKILGKAYLPPWLLCTIVMLRYLGNFELKKRAPKRTPKRGKRERSRKREEKRRSGVEIPNVINANSSAFIL
jgi:hypothetical protein